MTSRSSVIRVSVLGDATSLMKAFGSAGAAAKSFGDRLQRLGASWTRSISMPLAGIGIAAAKLSLDFESSMAKIEGLVGIAGDEVAGMGARVRELAGETARAPGELADALFFITSAGLRGSDAMDALEVSAKAATAGLGETEQVADAVTSAMNAYASTGLTAAESTDILVATVREGKLEASELSGSIGRVLPLASELGVSFNDVGASIAAMTRLGSNAAESVTALRAIFVTLAKPSQAANETLHEFGLSAGGLREQLREEGLLSVLTTLAETFDGNEEALTKVIPNVRALTGFLNLTGAAADEAAGIFERMQDTSGSLGDAFSAVAETDAFKLQQAIAELKGVLIPLGGEILTEVVPHLQTLGDVLSDAVSGFSDLDEGMQNTIIQVGLLVIALGPVLSVVGRLATLFSTIGTALGIGGGAIGGAFTGALGLVAIGAFLANWLDEQGIGSGRSPGPSKGKKTKGQMLGPDELPDHLTDASLAFSGSVSRVAEDLGASISNVRLGLDQEMRPALDSVATAAFNAADALGMLGDPQAEFERLVNTYGTDAGILRLAGFQSLTNVSDILSGKAALEQQGIPFPSGAEGLASAINLNGNMYVNVWAEGANPGSDVVRGMSDALRRRALESTDAVSPFTRGSNATPSFSVTPPAAAN